MAAKNDKLLFENDDLSVEDLKLVEKLTNGKFESMLQHIDKVINQKEFRLKRKKQNQRNNRLTYEKEAIQDKDQRSPKEIIFQVSLIKQMKKETTLVKTTNVLKYAKIRKLKSEHEYKTNEKP